MSGDEKYPIVGATVTPRARLHARMFARSVLRHFSKLPPELVEYLFEFCGREVFWMLRCLSKWRRGMMPNVDYVDKVVALCATFSDESYLSAVSVTFREIVNTDIIFVAAAGSGNETLARRYLPKDVSDADQLDIIRLAMEKAAAIGHKRIYELLLDAVKDVTAREMNIALRHGHLSLGLDIAGRLGNLSIAGIHKLHFPIPTEMSFRQIHDMMISKQVAGAWPRVSATRFLVQAAMHTNNMKLLTEARMHGARPTIDSTVISWKMLSEIISWRMFDPLEPQEILSGIFALASTSDTRGLRHMLNDAENRQLLGQDNLRVSLMAAIRRGKIRAMKILLPMISDRHRIVSCWTSSANTPRTLNAFIKLCPEAVSDKNFCLSIAVNALENGYAKMLQIILNATKVDLMNLHRALLGTTRTRIRDACVSKRNRSHAVRVLISHATYGGKRLIQDIIADDMIATSPGSQGMNLLLKFALISVIGGKVLTDMIKSIIAELKHQMGTGNGDAEKITTMAARVDAFMQLKINA